MKVVLCYHDRGNQDLMTSCMMDLFVRRTEYSAPIQNICTEYSTTERHSMSPYATSLLSLIYIGYIDWPESHLAATSA